MEIDFEKAEQIWEKKLEKKREAREEIIIVQIRAFQCKQELMFKRLDPRVQEVILDEPVFPEVEKQLKEDNWALTLPDFPKNGKYVAYMVPRKMHTPAGKVFIDGNELLKAVYEKEATEQVEAFKAVQKVMIEKSLTELQPVYLDKPLIKEVHQSLKAAGWSVINRQMPKVVFNNGAVRQMYVVYISPHTSKSCTSFQI